MIDAYEYGSGHVEYRGVGTVRETARGLLVEIDGQERWVAKRYLHPDSEVRGHVEGFVGTLIVPKWVAHEFDLVDTY